MPSFELTAKQQEANRLLASPARHLMLFGGSRSGKTFLIVRAICIRALKAANSRHAMLRFRLGHIKASIVLDTFPKVMRLCFPDAPYEMNKTDLFARFENGSEIWFGGLDDKDRTEKILGNEYASIFLNECSQIPWGSRNLAVTRLAQLSYQFGDRTLPLKMYYDENPPDKGHWTYKLFRSKQDPETRRPLAEADSYACMQLNPGDNLPNLGDGYIKTLEGLSSRLRKRFLEGEFREMAPDALFVDEVIDRWRHVDELPEMLKIVVAVDPSGSDEEDNLENDEIGIVVCGLGVDGIGYVLEDVTCKAGPATWGRIATQAFERWEANSIVAEINFGGAMVKFVIRSARPNTPFREVRASRGKIVRAEPVSSLVETGKVRIAGYLRALEDELHGFTSHGYMGERSPNRADAMVWGVSDLFPDLLAPKEKPKVQSQVVQLGRSNHDGLGWMEA